MKNIHPGTQMKTELPLTASEALCAMEQNKISSARYTQACIERIKSFDGKVQAWAHFDGARALAQAEALDKMSKNIGPLHGVPIGLKDIINTRDMPTACGSDLFSGRRPENDATVVRLLRDAGAIIMGKTVTTEFALSGAGATRNPCDLSRTPGGSSSGSAAAVACGMVPLSIGSQTGGSMLRPASYCGIYGFKPTFGSISRAGVFILSRRLDHLGIYARCLEDLALVADVLMMHDPADTESHYNSKQMLCDAMLEKAQNPRIGIYKGEAWTSLEDGTENLFNMTAEKLGARAVLVPEEAVDALSLHITIMNASATANLGCFVNETNKILPETLKRVSAGMSISAAQYVNAIDRAAVVTSALNQIFDDVDVLLTPAATGEAPIGIKYTGNPVMQKTWTLAGMPTISLPVMKGPNGLPIGLQVIGQYGHDAELLRHAAWIERELT